MAQPNIKPFNVFFETQWPRIMEIQKSFHHARVRAENYHDYWMTKRKERKERLLSHCEKIHDHRVWMLKKQLGQDVNWVTAWVDRTGNLKDIPRGNGYRGEVLQYIYWTEKK